MPATKTALDGDKKDDVDIRDEKVRTHLHFSSSGWGGGSGAPGLHRAHTLLPPGPAPSDARLHHCSMRSAGRSARRSAPAAFCGVHDTALALRELHFAHDTTPPRLTRAVAPRCAQQHLAVLGYKQELKRQMVRARACLALHRSPSVAGARPASTLPLLTRAPAARTLQTYYGSVGTTLGCSQVRQRAACCGRQRRSRCPNVETMLTSAPPQPLLCAGVFYVR
jgi:hypothetical protein